MYALSNPHIINRLIRILQVVVAANLLFLLFSCEKEEDMVLDRVVAPVLITVSSGSFGAAEDVVLSATVVELDKSGLLNYQVGIDSIPVANLAMVLYASGAKVAEAATDAQGKISLTKTWAELGLATPKANTIVNLEWSGQHKGQAFTKQTKVQVK